MNVGWVWFGWCRRSSVLSPVALLADLLELRLPQDSSSRTLLTSEAAEEANEAIAFAWSKTIKEGVACGPVRGRGYRTQRDGCVGKNE